MGCMLPSRLNTACFKYMFGKKYAYTLLCFYTCQFKGLKWEKHIKSSSFPGLEL